MTATSTTIGRERPRLCKRYTALLLSVHVLGFAAIAYIAVYSISPWTALLAVAWLLLSGLSITAGYHRLFTHRAYQARVPLRAVFLLFGAAAVQKSVVAWASDHRRHHALTDQDDDPYDARRGFWWPHMGWILYDVPERVAWSRVQDLVKDPLARLQHRIFVPLAVFMLVVLPGALGLIWGDPLGAILVVGFLRLVVQWHMTFAVNSLAHMIGTRLYDENITARDSWATALITLGEGYHNFHHRFQTDYRNGYRWYHIDPTKWFIWTLARLRLAAGLRRTPSDVIARARVTRPKAGTGA